MSSRVATLLVGLLAIAEGRSNDRQTLQEANIDEVLDVISPVMLDRIAQRLYADDQAHLSAYERLLQNDKRKKMEYLNNIRPDLVPQQPEVQPASEAPERHHNDHYTLEDIPKSDPTKESILD